MTLYLFCLLSPKAQLLYARLRGTCLAQRWENKGRVTLYHLADKGRGFFAEIGLDEAQKRFVVLRSFSDSVPLEAYAKRVRLPE